MENPVTACFVEKNFIESSLIHSLHTVYSYAHVRTTELGVCDRTHRAHKHLNIKYIDLYPKQKKFGDFLIN